MNNITSRMIYDLDGNDGSPISDIPVSTEPLQGYNIETINRLILMDGERNKRVDSKVMWWVDVSSSTCRDTEMNRYMKAFGIPESTKDGHNMLNGQRVSYSNGEVICQGLSSSPAFMGTAAILSFFVQPHYIANHGVVDGEPRLLKCLPFDIGKYFVSRFGSMYSRSSVPCFAKARLVGQIDELGKDLLDSSRFQRQTETYGNSKISSCHQSKLPLPSVGVVNETPFLLNAADLKSRKPCIKGKVLSLHIQDQGYGPIALVTFREMGKTELNDGSRVNQKWSLDQHSRTGVLGWALQCVWTKLLEVNLNCSC